MLTMDPPVIAPDPIEPTCSCENKQTTSRTLSNGTIQYTPQCLRCGRAWPAVRRDSLTPRQREQLPSFDNSLVDAWQERISEYHKQRRTISEQKRNAEWAALKPERQREYHEYLRTPQWAEKRDKVMRRANHMCEGCADISATQVHHLTYLHIGKEFLFELVAVCRYCHQRLHSDESRLTWGDD